MKIINYLLGFFLIVFVSCIDKKKDIHSSLESIVFDADLSSKFDFSSICDTTFSIIPLETNDQCLIANIDKIEMKNDRLIILDQLAKSVFIFEMNGAFLSKINMVGKGPGEYLAIQDIAVTDTSIFLIDHLTGKKIEYSYEGTFKSEERVYSKLWATEIFSYDSMIYYLNDWSSSNSGNYRLFSTERNSSVINKYLTFLKEPVAMGINGPSYSIFNKGVSLIYSGCDTIFSISKENNICAKYRVDFKGNKVQNNSGKVENIFNENSKEKIVGLNRINESNRYLFLDVQKINEKNLMIYDKIMKHTYIAPSLNNFTYFGSVGCHLQRVVDNKILQFVNASQLLVEYKYCYSKNDFKSKRFKNEFDELMENYKESDNPVIFVYQLLE